MAILTSRWTAKFMIHLHFSESEIMISSVQHQFRIPAIEHLLGLESICKVLPEGAPCGQFETRETKCSSTAGGWQTRLELQFASWIMGDRSGAIRRRS